MAPKRIDVLGWPLDQQHVTGLQADVDVSVAFGTVAVAYELPLEQSFTVDGYVGARWWHVSSGADVQVQTAGPGAPGPFQASLTESWVNAVVGARWRYDINDRFRLAALADVGGGQASIDWSAFAGLTWFAHPNVGLTAGYRFNGVDYSNNGFVYDFKQNGLLLGLNLRY